MAKKKLLTKFKPELKSGSKLKIEKGIIMPSVSINHRSPSVKWPEDYALLESFEDGDSTAFNTEEDSAKIKGIISTLMKLFPERHYAIRKVNDEESRVWRNDNSIRKKAQKKRGPYNKNKKSE